MENNQNINNLISNVTQEINKIYSLKKIPLKIKKYLKIIITGMIINYGNKFTNEIYNKLRNINFIIGKRNITKYLSTNSLNYKIINKDIYTMLKVKQNNNLITYNIFIGDYYLDYEIFTFEFLTSQLNKILCNNSKDNSYSFNTRLISYKNMHNNLSFNEIINSLQVESIIKNILKLKEYNIKDKCIKDFLKYLDKINYQGYICNEYINGVTLFRKLYENNSFRTLIDKSLLNGNIDDIKNDFDYYLGVNSYNGICDLLNKLSIETQIMPYVKNTYDISTLYCQIRTILDNYMKNKYAK